MAPLHNPANIDGILACQKLMPNTPQVAVFDTAFHQTMEAKSYLYALPYEYYEKHKIRRYGFHGTSHKYVAGRVAELMGKDVSELKIITCHIGNGASITAINKGKVIDTSMGLTPLEGLVMGTRSGDMDPAVVLFLQKIEKLSIDEVDTILNKKSGLLGISGTSNDVRDILSSMEQGDERAKIAFEMMTYRIKKYIGSYVAALNGVDAIVFTAGVGERGIAVRKNIVESLGWLGVELDATENQKGGQEVRISSAHSQTQVWVVPTNEEYMIAKDAYEIATK